MKIKDILPYLQENSPFTVVDLYDPSSHFTGTKLDVEREYGEYPLIYVIACCGSFRIITSSEIL